MIIIREETDYTEAIEAYKNEPAVILEPWGRSIDHLRLTIIGKKEHLMQMANLFLKLNFQTIIHSLLHMLMLLP